MKIFFIGTVSFSALLLKEIMTLEQAEVVGLATKSKSSVNSDHQDLAPLAIEAAIPYKYVKDINAPHILEWITSLKPDVVFCFGWSSLIKKPLLELTPLGVIGYHPSALPYNRGRHPIIWALVLGLNQTASTFFRMDEGADTGDILDQELVDIAFEDKASDLYNNLNRVALVQVRRFLPRLHNREVEWISQKGLGEGNVWRKRGRNDGQIDFRMSTVSIYNLVRGLTRPYVGAHINYGEKEIKVWNTQIGPKVDDNLEPGKVLQSDSEKGILIKTGDGSIWLKDFQKVDGIESASYIS